MPLPDLDPEERAAALEKAAEIRKARAELKVQLKQGKVTLREVLDRAEHDEVVGKLKVSALLQAMPGIGKIRASQILEKLRIADSRRVRGLSEQQRRALLEVFAYSAPESDSSSPPVTRTVLRPQSRLDSHPPISEGPRWYDERLRASGYDLWAAQERGGGLTVVLASPAERLQDAIDRNSAVLHLPTQAANVKVDAYLDTDDPNVVARVLSAVDELASVLGYDGPLDVETRRGSWWRRSIAAVKRALTSDDLASRLKKVERAIEISYLDTRQAQVDSAEAQAVSQLIEALRDTPQACIRVGSLFLVKYEGSNGPVLLARTLSPVEVNTIEHFPEIQTNPRTALEALATAIATVDADSRSPRRLTS